MSVVVSAEISSDCIYANTDVWLGPPFSSRGCLAQLRAKNLSEHIEYHQLAAGFALYTTPGAYTYTVPVKTQQLKVQVWGAGGGRYAGRKDARASKDRPASYMCLLSVAIYWRGLVATEVAVGLWRRC
jgi:hypothetical protein